MNKRAKTSKKSVKLSPEYDSERETRVLLEQVRGEVGLVAEQHSSIVEKLEKITNTLSSHDSSFFKMEMNIEMVKSKTGTIDTKVDRIEKKLDNVAVEYNDRFKRVEEKIGV